MLPTLQFSADLFAFVKEIFYWNFHFLGSDRPTIGKLILTALYNIRSLPRLKLFMNLRFQSQYSKV